MAAGIILMLAIWIAGLNIVALVGAVFLMATAVAMTVGVLVKKRVYMYMLFGYIAVSFGIITLYIFNGADGGWGAFTSARAGYSTANSFLQAGNGNFGTRLAGNLLIFSPMFILIPAIILIPIYVYKSGVVQRALTTVACFLLIAMSVSLAFTMNLRLKPKVDRMWKGHDAYLNGIQNGKTKADSPNVLFIMLDDLGYGDISLNGAIYPTPNIDSIGVNGLQFENFYSSYSVCSPARFAAMTGRYPYRGYADNVIYPTVNCMDPFARTRFFNAAELGANVDGMLGDEITIAETLKNAGYSTGLFGKWHLGDYGEYLPTNQGFDYFYGSHHVNDMDPFYHVEEVGGEYTVAVGADELKDQKNATKLIHNHISDWITEQASSEKPFFAWYTSPWPHAPIYVGDEFKGKTGMGDYVDCVTEFDYYLGELFDTMKEAGVYDNTIIVFTSDNGPALQGSTADLRGGKYLAYEGGQKVPFLMQWKNGNVWTSGDKVDGTATMIDLYPTLVDLCGVTDKDGNGSYMPFDREIDGVSMMPLLTKEDNIIHDDEHPILYMKREKIKSVSYSEKTADILARPEYADYGKYDVMTDRDYVSFKYFRNMQNDNVAFFDKRRVNWLHILSDDVGENYNRQKVYSTIATKMDGMITEWTEKFAKNRRGINADWYRNGK